MSANLVDMTNRNKQLQQDLKQMDTVIKTLKSDKGENFNPNIQKSESYFIELEKEKRKVNELEKEIEEL